MGQMTQSAVASTEGSSGPKYQASILPGAPHHVKIIQRAIYSDRKIHLHYLDASLLHLPETT